MWLVRRLGITFLFAAILACSACQGVENAAAPKAGFRTFKDNIGREVQLPQTIDRAISLAPSITETIFVAGAGSKLIGDTTYCNYPPEAQSIAKVGDTQNPNIETIVTLKPQVVFVSTASQLETYQNVLSQQNIAYFIVDVRSVEDVPKSVRQIGDILGTSDAANAAASELSHRIEAVENKTRGSKKVRTFLQVSEEPLFTIGKDSFMTALVELAGGESVTRDLPSGYPRLSKETALALRPEMIILSDSEDNKEPNEAFKNSPAVKNGKVMKINADILSRPGPRLVDALEQIASYLNSNYSENR